MEGVGWEGFDHLRGFVGMKGVGRGRTEDMVCAGLAVDKMCTKIGYQCCMERAGRSGKDIPRVPSFRTEEVGEGYRGCCPF